jgi:hypothetical protein
MPGRLSATSQQLTGAVMPYWPSGCQAGRRKSAHRAKAAGAEVKGLQRLQRLRAQHPYWRYPHELRFMECAAHTSTALVGRWGRECRAVDTGASLASHAPAAHQPATLRTAHCYSHNHPYKPPMGRQVAFPCGLCRGRYTGHARGRRRSGAAQLRARCRAQGTPRSRTRVYRAASAASSIA